MSKPTHALSSSDLAGLRAIIQSGGRGLSRADILTALGNVENEYAVKRFLERTRKCGHAIVKFRVGRDGPSDIFRYALAEHIEVPAQAVRLPAIPSVSRRVSGDIGLGATPGAMVSVARVSFLDGASA